MSMPVLGWQHLGLWHGLEFSSVDEIHRGLNAGANPNARRQLGHAFEHPFIRPDDTPLHALMRRANNWNGPVADMDRAAYALLVAGADPMLTSGALTPMDMACALPRPVVSDSTFKRLAQACRGRLDTCGPDGRTPLMNTARHGRTSWMNILLDLGAQPQLRDHSGWNALWHAAQLEENNARQKTPLLVEPVEWTLIENRCRAGETDHQGRTVLMVMEHLPVQPWVSRGVNPNHRAPGGHSLLWNTLVGIQWSNWCVRQKRLLELFDIDGFDWKIESPEQQSILQWLASVNYPANAQTLVDQLRALHEKAILGDGQSNSQGARGTRRL